MDATAADQRTDGDLLAAFGWTGDEAPFAALVRRHETMVYNACLRVLREPSDAEDAAQAVFLALSSKARDPSLHRRASLAGWLYEAAWHVGMHARDAARLRKQREREAGTMQEKLANASPEWCQLAPALDGELNALPEKYRLPIVLHHLEQRTVEETAALVQCSTDAVKQRLSRGREMLKDRLTRRGVLLSAVVIPALLATHASAATLPVTFAGSTAKAAVLFISGKAFAGEQVAALAEAAAVATSRSAFIRRLRAPLWAAAALLLVCGAAGAAWRLLWPPPAAPTVLQQVAREAKGASGERTRGKIGDSGDTGVTEFSAAPDLRKRVETPAESGGKGQSPPAKSRKIAKEEAPKEAEARAEAGTLAKEKEFARVEKMEVAKKLAEAEARAQAEKRIAKAVASEQAMDRTEVDARKKAEAQAQAAAAAKLEARKKAEAAAKEEVKNDEALAKEQPAPKPAADSKPAAAEKK